MDSTANLLLNTDDNKELYQLSPIQFLHIYLIFSLHGKRADSAGAAWNTKDFERGKWLAVRAVRAVRRVLAPPRFPREGFCGIPCDEDATRLPCKEIKS